MNSATIDLDALVVGARVAWVTYGNLQGPSAYVGVVSRFTPTQIIVSGAHPGRPNEQDRFRRSDGSMIGTYRTYLQSPDDDVVVKARAGQRFRAAVHDIETLAHAIDGRRNPGQAEEQLDQIVKLAHRALLALGDAR